VKRNDSVLIHSGGSGVGTGLYSCVVSLIILVLTVGKVKKSDIVLIHAGGSGVGTAAVQLCGQSDNSDIDCR
jgi:NADPH:quinone reductase-like Zn-dependent oxidoreductase